MTQVERLRFDLKRVRRLMERPRRHYWKRFTDEVQAKKFNRLGRKADALSSRLFALTGEEA